MWSDSRKRRSATTAKALFHGGLFLIVTIVEKKLRGVAPGGDSGETDQQWGRAYDVCTDETRPDDSKQKDLSEVSA